MCTNDTNPGLAPDSVQPGRKDASARQPYESPVLVVYGSLRELTQNVGQGTEDGILGTGGMN